MYQLISAIGKNIEEDTRWHEVEIGDMPMNTIFSTFSRVTATLSNNFLVHHVSLDLANIRAATGGLTITFNDWLTNNGNATLPTSDVLPVINTRYAKYADAFHAGYKVQACPPGLSPDAALPPSEKTWLFLKHPKEKDYSLMYRSVIPVVNGFLHASDASSDGFYVQDGMKSQMISGSNLLGLIRFREVGSLSFIKITPDMLYRQNERQKYRYQCFIDSGMDLSTKTVMLVLGGYLHVLDEKTFFRVSDSSFCVNFNNIPMWDRYYESVNYIDLSSMGLDTSTVNKSQISVDQLLSDEALTAYCTLSQSFFVVLDNPDIFMDRVYLEAKSGPGMYETTEPPIYPMVAGHGRIVNYWYQWEKGLYSVTTYDTAVHRHLYDTTNPLVQGNISDSKVSQNPDNPSLAYFMRIGTDI